ncbi:metallophosphoesterase family protein [Alienimonas sp. DA493]|uniref:metallophosphoesterase family protein n=1 Tax=Alienimonas sp. DA493 TaxID=3373605 RepID=UPI0037540B3E
MTVFFTADTHFGHANIVKHCDRPFEDVAAMDEVLIRNWNAVVGPRDVVYHLGDFAFRARRAPREYLARLHGTVHLIRGNHDAETLKDCPDAFASLSDLKEIKVDRQRITLCHYAMRTWNKSHRGAWHLYGHTHGNLPDDPESLSLDVGVDCHAFAPVPFERVAELMAAKTPPS